MSRPGDAYEVRRDAVLPLFAAVERDIPRARVERDFQEYMKTPHGQTLETAILAMARRLREAGRDRYGIAALFEVVRYERALVGKHEDGFKCNNSFRSHMARKIMRDNPDLVGFFELRELRGR